MSCFLMDESKIIELAKFAVSRDHSGGGYNVNMHIHGKDLNNCSVEPAIVATDYAIILILQNMRSYNARYPDLGRMAEPCKDDTDIKISWDQVYKRSISNPVHIIKLCHCLKYQSCETDDYESTTAYKLLKKIENAAIRQLPGYQSAPWG